WTCPRSAGPRWRRSAATRLWAVQQRAHESLRRWLDDHDRDAERGTEIARRDVVEKYTSPVTDGRGRDQHGVAQWLSRQLRLDVLSGQEPRDADPAPEPVVRDRGHADREPVDLERVDERVQARREHLARDDSDSAR